MLLLTEPTRYQIFKIQKYIYFKMSKMSFDEACQKAVNYENAMYSKKFPKDSYFKVKRRNSKQLYLSCRRDKTCKFSIRYSKTPDGNVKNIELKQIHTCSLEACRKTVLRVRQLLLKYSCIW
jgi:hypothetical protein